MRSNRIFSTNIRYPSLILVEKLHFKMKKSLFYFEIFIGLTWSTWINRNIGALTSELNPIAKLSVKNADFPFRITHFTYCVRIKAVLKSFKWVNTRQWTKHEAHDGRTQNTSMACNLKFSMHLKSFEWASSFLYSVCGLTMSTTAKPLLYAQWKDWHKTEAN